MKRNFLAFVIPVFLIQNTFALAEVRSLVPEATQSRIVEHFSAGDCGGVQSLVSGNDVFKLRPNIMAIAAYCEIPGVESQKVFEAAEAADPSGDLILTLHAKYTWKKDPEAAKPIWQKVLMHARNPYLSSMAEQYLSGMVTEDKPISLSRTTYYASLMLGLSDESNVKPFELAYAPSASSRSLNLQTRFNAQHWFPYGSLSVNYFLNVNQRFEAKQYNFISHELDVPYALHAGKNEDIVFRPLAGLSTLSGRAFQTKIGIGVLGIVYRSTYKQSIQGIFYSDHYSVSEISGEDADHFRFEYAWEFYPGDWIVSFQPSAEHARADNTRSYAGIPGNFNNAHTDLALEFNAQKELKYFTFGLYSKIKTRSDSQQSRFISPLDGSVVRKDRSDLEFLIRPSLTLPVIAYVHLYAWYEWRRVSSNIDQNDYVNRNFLDQTIGVALKTYLSSY